MVAHSSRLNVYGPHYFLSILRPILRIFKLKLQVGMVAHSSRLNVYGPPSSRGLHNVTAVSRFLLYFHKRFYWVVSTWHICHHFCCKDTDQLFNRPTRWSLCLSIWTGAPTCLKSLIPTRASLILPLFRRDVLLICPVSGYPLDKVYFINILNSLII